MKDINLFVICLILSGIYFYNKNLKDNLIILSLFGLFILLFYNNNEHMTTDESIQNLASMFNSGTLRATNVDITGDLTVNGKSVLSGETIVKANATFNSDVNIKNDAFINKNLNVVGKTTMKSNLELNENLKMKDKKIIALGDIGLVYSNLSDKPGEGHFSMFRGFDGHNLITQQVGINEWATFCPNGQFFGKPWGNASTKIYEKPAFDSMKITKDPNLFA